MTDKEGFEIPSKTIRGIMNAAIFKALDGDIDAARFVYEYAGVEKKPVEHRHNLSSEYMKLATGERAGEK